MYARIEPGFWIGETGRAIRAAGRDAQVVAMYLVTGPAAFSLGLYYLPLPLLCHEIAIDREAALKALGCLSDVGFAFYDEPAEVVFVPTMARFQVAESIKAKDKRHAWIVKEAARMRKLPYFSQWYERYREVFQLPDLAKLGRAFEAPSMPTATPIATATTVGEKSAPTMIASLRCPEKWKPRREETEEIAGQLRLTDADIDTQLANFREHEFTTPRSDWHAAWRKWLRGTQKPRRQQRQRHNGVVF